MPTSRTLAFLVTASLLYFFANQTQVGWIYVMAAFMAGTVLAAWWLGRNALKRITADRTIAPSDPPHEGDAVTVSLTFRNTRSDSHIRTLERCPFADPHTPTHPIPIFIPSLPTNAPIRLEYDVTVDRRGLHEYPPLKLESPAPFGLFRRRRPLPLPTRLLVYPEVRPLRRLALFDRQPAALLAHPRPGIGTEFIGVRPFHSGDSPRHIHWRSVARTQQLISKEFADDTQPGLTLALDLFRHPYPQTDSKHTPFEWAVKIAASIGDYAHRRHYHLHLLGDDSAWPPPPGPLSATALLEYLARIQPTGALTLADVLTNRATQTFVAALLPWPDESAVESLVALRQRGCEVLAVVLDPDSFPASGLSGRALADGLTSAGIESRLIRHGSDWVSQLTTNDSNERMPRSRWTQMNADKR